MSTKNPNTDDQNADYVETMGRPRHHVPEGVIHGILRLLPTIPAARMSFLSKQWEGLRSLGCVLDFVEDNLDGELDDRPRNFINTCDRYLDQFRECDKISIHKFRLHMRYSSEDANMVDEWLNFAVERGVKELDINLPSGGKRDKKYCFHLQTIANAAKTLTSFNVENVECDPYFSFRKTIPSTTFLYLKSLSLKSVKLWCFNMFFERKFKCPSIEYLSLTSLTSGGYNYFCFSSSSLKSLEIMLCPDLWKIGVLDAVNLESFKFVSSSELVEGYSLKHVLISGAKHLRNFELYGCKDNVKATIITRNMSLSMSGFLKSSSLDPELWEARITLPDTELPAFDCSSKHFSSLRDYLECFDCFKEITLEVDDAKALIFPENFRQTRSPPLLNLNILEVTSKVSPQTRGDISALRNSLVWMAPSAKILLPVHRWNRTSRYQY
ncbi:hypothetical protein ACFX13_046537 [Malus domestica]